MSLRSNPTKLAMLCLLFGSSAALAQAVAVGDLTIDTVTASVSGSNLTCTTKVKHVSEDAATNAVAIVLVPPETSNVIGTTSHGRKCETGPTKQNPEPVQGYVLCRLGTLNAKNQKKPGNIDSVTITVTGKLLRNRYPAGCRAFVYSDGPDDPRTPNYKQSN